MADIYLLYAALAAMSMYVAFLTVFGRHITHRHIEIALGNLVLSAAFAFLAVGRSGIFGVAHGDLAFFTRLLFALYGVCLLVIIGRYWLIAWRERTRHTTQSQSDVSRNER
jgi:hypothetical protein